MTLPENSTAAASESVASRVVPTSFDHVALWVADREPIVDLLCRHLGMHVIDTSDTFSLVGADARRGKLTLFDAPGPREPGVLGHVALRVGDLDAALAALPPDLEVERDGSEARFEAFEGLRLGLVEAPGTDLDYDLDHVVLRVSDVERVADGLARLGLQRYGDRLVVAGRRSASRAEARRRASGRCSTTSPCSSTPPRSPNPRRAAAATASPTSSTPPTRSPSSSGARIASSSSTSSTSPASR